ncbi:hypothetical protein ABKW28_20410 [Nocardioides sp. 31GB23]|uniref:hypothetical protein n=1 Tax=Nocardioides sp. 31GB23 TaxID=3156065 RepID=UPI0032AFF85C
MILEQPRGVATDNVRRRLIGSQALLISRLGDIMYLRSLADKQRREVEFHGEVFGHTDLISSVDGPDAPHAFVVDQPSGTVIPTHFHAINQFQVFLTGDGTIGRKPIAPVTVHYTNAFTGYGPIVAGQHGLRYLTLRPRHHAESKAQVLPGAREAQHAAPRRHRLGTVAADKPRDHSAVDEQILVPREDDGLFASYLSVTPGHILKLPPCGGSGRFLLLFDGSFSFHDVVSHPVTCVYLAPDERPELEAGGKGAQLLVLDYPSKVADARL